jgi:hypothetical protein
LEAGKGPNLKLFEPYGMRFHAELEQGIDENSAKAALQTNFKIRTIKPTLEDVFIRLVEGAGR